MNSRSKFADQVGANIEQDKSRKGGFSYLSLPRGVELFKVEGGDRIEVDFLPYVITDEKHPDRNDKKDIALPGYEWYRRPYSKHGNVGVDNISVVCPGSIGKKCPICEYRSKLVKQGKQYDDDEVKAFAIDDTTLFLGGYFRYVNGDYHLGVAAVGAKPAAKAPAPVAGQAPSTHSEAAKVTISVIPEIIVISFFIPLTHFRLVHG